MRHTGPPGVGVRHGVVVGRGEGIAVGVSVGIRLGSAVGIDVGESNGVAVGITDTGVGRMDVAAERGSQATNPSSIVSATVVNRLFFMMHLPSLRACYPHRATRVRVPRHLLHLAARNLQQPNVGYTTGSLP